MYGRLSNNREMGAREKSQSIKCLPAKHEDLSSDSQQSESIFATSALRGRARQIPGIQQSDRLVDEISA
jgi:hypothetical protein